MMAAAASNQAADVDLQSLLESRLDEAVALLKECETVFNNVAGVGKLRGKIQAELQFLQEVRIVNEFYAIMLLVEKYWL